MVMVMVMTWSARSTNEPSGKGFPSLLQEITGGGCPSPYNNIIMVLILWVLMVMMMMVMAVVNIEYGNQDKSSEMDDLRRVSPNNRFQFQSNWSSISSQPMDLMTLIIVMMAMLTKKITISLYTALVINDGAELIHADVTLQTKASSSPCLSFSFPESTPRIWTDAGTG